MESEVVFAVSFGSELGVELVAAVHLVVAELATFLQYGGLSLGSSAFTHGDVEVVLRGLVFRVNISKVDVVLHLIGVACLQLHRGRDGIVIAVAVAVGIECQTSAAGIPARVVEHRPVGVVVHDGPGIGFGIVGKLSGVRHLVSGAGHDGIRFGGFTGTLIGGRCDDVGVVQQSGQISVNQSGFHDVFCHHHRVGQTQYAVSKRSGIVGTHVLSLSGSFPRKVDFAAVAADLDVLHFSRSIFAGVNIPAVGNTFLLIHASQYVVSADAVNGSFVSPAGFGTRSKSVGQHSDRFTVEVVAVDVDGVNLGQLVAAPAQRGVRPGQDYL